ncbi:MULTISPECIES: MFS transporter [unclassified Saccharothrix]|uniref:MFS transporter n=1 Tax=unclassified Saccharothrix TaxID=2593673 RepID=UPI00307CF3BB
MTDMATTAPARRAGLGWAILASSLPMFVVALNNLVVTNALPQIEEDFGADQTTLQWVVNAYVLAFAGMLLTGAALGDRYGRKLMFLVGIGIFSLGSVACALAYSSETLIAARVVQGIGAAAILPLSLTILAAAVSEKMRSAAIGIWSGINGLGVALGPLVGGAVTEGLDWKWIFWVNLPVGVVAVPLVLWAIAETRGADRGLDIPGVVLVTGLITSLVWGIVRAGDDGWTSTPILTAFGIALVLLIAFVLWERKAKSPLLPLRFYRIPNFVLSNVVSLAMYFGVFGSIFFLAQYLQGPLGFSPLEAGVRTLPWTAMPMIVAPLAGLITDKVGGGRLMALGLALQGVGLGWIASIATTTTPYGDMVPAMVIAGIGMGLVFAPTTAVVLGSVQPHEHGKASGANNTVREIGGALGIAVLTTVFTDYFNEIEIRKPADAAEAFVHGMVPAIWVGVVFVGVGALAGLFISKRVAAASSPQKLVEV